MSEKGNLSPINIFINSDCSEFAQIFDFRDIGIKINRSIFTPCFKHFNSSSLLSNNFHGFVLCLLMLLQRKVKCSVGLKLKHRVYEILSAAKRNSAKQFSVILRGCCSCFTFYLSQIKICRPTNQLWVMD